MKLYLRLLYLLILACHCTAAAAEYQAVLFVPRDNPFWERFNAFATAAADDIGLQVKIYNAENSPQRMLEQVLQAATNKVDAILFMEYAGIGESILKIAEQHKIPALLFNTSLDDKSLLPRVHYRQWIGGIFPDDRKAGSRLTTQLLNAAEKNGAKTFRILAHSGRANERSQNRRFQGLKSIVDARSDVTLVDTIQTQGDTQAVASDLLAALKQHPDINIVWSPTDQIAMVVAKSYQQTGVGEAIMFGGIDWNPEVMAGINKVQNIIDLGGHDFDGAQAVIMIHDYLNGHDFADEKLLFESNMIAANKQNVDNFQKILANPKTIDYKALSKTLNPELRQYRFDLNAIAKAANSRVALTAEEQQWINDHPVIRYAAEKNWGLYDFINEEGNQDGLVKDYLELISQNSGLHFQPEANEWANLVEKTKQGKIDLMPAIYYTQSRAKYLSFTRPYQSIQNYFFIRDDIKAESLEDLKGKTIAMPKGYAHIETIRKRFPQFKLLVTKDLMSAVQSVIEKKADILLEGHSIVNHLLNRNGITSIRTFKVLPKELTTDLHMAVRKDQVILASILDKALAAIPQAEKRRVHGKWSYKPPDKQQNFRLLHLSEAERQWLQEHSVIRFTGDPNWLPYEAFDKYGNYIVSDRKSIN